MSKHLLLTIRGFSFRMRVPRDLQALIGKRELKKSLKTSDLRTAERLAALCECRLCSFSSISEGITWPNPIITLLLPSAR